MAWASTKTSMSQHLAPDSFPHAPQLKRLRIEGDTPIRPLQGFGRIQSEHRRQAQESGHFADGPFYDVYNTGSAPHGLEQQIQLFIQPGVVRFPSHSSPAYQIIRAM